MNNKQLITVNQNVKSALIKSKNLLDITKKILDKKNDDNWVQKLWEWADENSIPNYDWTEYDDWYKCGYYNGLPRNKDELLQLTKLYLSDDPLELDTLPDEIYNLVNLEEINLSGLGIKRLSFKIKQFKKLKKLDLGGSRYHGYNNLKTLPEELAELEHLEEINLWDSGIEGIPKVILKLKRLKKLSLGAYSSDGCDGTMDNLSSDIGNFIALEHLNLWGNELIELPKEVGLLVNLKCLNLGANNLKALPNEIVNLTNLKELDLSFGNSNLLLTVQQKQWIEKLKNSCCQIRMHGFMSEVYNIEKQVETRIPEIDIDEDEIPF